MSDGSAIKVGDTIYFKPSRADRRGEPAPRADPVVVFKVGRLKAYALVGHWNRKAGFSLAELASGEGAAADYGTRPARRETHGRAYRSLDEIEPFEAARLARWKAAEAEQLRRSEAAYRERKAAEAAAAERHAEMVEGLKSIAARQDLSNLERVGVSRALEALAP